MKKVLSLALVLVLALGMTTVASAFTTDKNPSATVHGFQGLHASEGGIASGLADISAEPGDKIEVRLATNAAFEVATAAGQSFSNPNVGYTKKELTKVIARTRISKGANAIKDAGINFDGPSKTAQLFIEFVKPFANTNVDDGVAFDVWIYPVVDGKTWKYQDYGFNFVGNLRNPSVDVDKDTDYVDMYTGVIANIKEAVRDIRYDLGPEQSAHDVVLVGRGIKSQKYWGVANNDVSETDADLMDKYDIDQVYHIQSIGLDKVTNHVELNASKNDFIFDGDLKFLGKGDSKTIPYATTYYVADHMIEVEADEEPLENGDEDVDPLVVPPETGGFASAPSGIFNNPSTGA